MMDSCRICLSCSANKDICELKINKEDSKENFSEILLFCLDIKVTESSIITRKLCSKCYKKILSYHKFKTLALRNDSYLKSLNLDCAVKLEVTKEDYDWSNNNCNPIQTYDDDVIFDDKIPMESVKDEPNIRTEVVAEACESDDELLTVIKKIKEEESSSNNTIPLNGCISPAEVKKIGRPKKIKPETNHSEKKMCEECGKYVKNLKEHSAKHLPLQQRKRFKCKVCDKMFCSYAAVYKHNKFKHLGYKSRCDICDKEVRSIHNHMLRVHNPDKMKAVCVLCDKRYVSQSLLDIHMLSHTKDKPHECNICHKKFRLKIVLKHHIRQIHEKEKSHLCQFCSKTFFKKYHLVVHLRSHTKERPFKCEQCGRAFTNCSSYKSHKETHGTEKNYHCAHCDMKFVRRDYLRTHMVIHTKEKRYPCKYCGVRFGRSDHRKRHQFTAHEKHLLQDGGPL